MVSKNISLADYDELLTHHYWWGRNSTHDHVREATARSEQALIEIAERNGLEFQVLFDFYAYNMANVTQAKTLVKNIHEQHFVARKYYPLATLHRVFVDWYQSQTVSGIYLTVAHTLSVIRSESLLSV